MLHNILLKAGQYNQITKQGSHINIMLAAGEIEVRIEYDGGAVEQTNLVSGMAFETRRKFNRISFKSDVDQQTKVWLSDLPLTYSPLDSKLVGSNALKSIAGQAFSGGAYELLGAESSRNQVTIVPQGEIYIGGTNVSLKNGIRIGAGERFSLHTQGAIYAIETSGNYPPSYTTIPSLSNFQSPEFLDVSAYGAAAFEHVHSSDDGQVLFVTRDGAAGINKVNPQTLATMGSITWSGTVKGERTSFDYAGKIHMPTANGNLYQWTTFDKSTEAVTQEDIVNQVSRFCRHIAANGTKRMALVTDGNASLVSVMLSINGAAFAATPVPTDKAGSVPHGLAIDSNGALYVFFYGGNVQKSTDDGANWFNYTSPANDSWGIEMAMVIDANDVLYVAEKGQVFSSVDGAVTWQQELAVQHSSTDHIRTLDARGDTVLVAGDWNRNIKIDGQWYSKDESQDSQRGGGITAGGYIFVNRYKGNQTVIRGETVPMGGLPVSIMAEVN